MDEAERRAAERRPTAKLGGGVRLAVLALAGAGVLWGVSFLFGKWALEEMGPAHVTLVRFALALAVLLVQGLGQRAEGVIGSVLGGSQRTLGWDSLLAGANTCLGGARGCALRRRAPPLRPQPKSRWSS